MNHSTRNIVLLIMLAAFLLSACSTKKVDEMEQREDETYWITISNIGACRVKFDDYVLCSVGDFVKILGQAHGRGYYRVRCWQ